MGFVIECMYHFGHTRYLFFKKKDLYYKISFYPHGGATINPLTKDEFYEDIESCKEDDRVMERLTRSFRSAITDEDRLEYISKAKEDEMVSFIRKYIK